MELGILVLKQTILMFLLMAVGYVVYRKKIISDSGAGELGKLLVNLAIPAVILNSCLTDYQAERFRNLCIAAVLSLLSLVLSMVICQILYGNRHRLNNFGNAFSNAGFIGIPLVSAVLGEEAVFYVSAYVAFLNILQQTYGIWVITGSGDSIRPKKVMRNPVLLAFILGMLLYVLPIPIPALVSSAVSYVAGLNTPLAMMILGIYLAQSSLKDVLCTAELYAASAVRLLLIPAITMAMLTILPVSTLIKMTVLIAAAAPVGANVAIFAQLYGQDYTYGAKLVCNSTILSIVTMPVLVAVASMIW